MAELYGSARLLTRASGPGSVVANTIRPEGSNGILLGLNKPGSPNGLSWWPASKRGHALCFSATGGGKNTNLITGALLTYLGSSLTLDPKGENAWITAPRRRELGQRAVILDPYDQVNQTYGARVGVREEISRFNPLASLDPASPDFNDQVSLIADGVVIVPEGVRETHWGDSARELIGGLIAASVESAPGVASFRDVRRLLTGSDAALQAVVDAIVASNPDSVAGRKLRRFANAPKNSSEIASIRSTAETQTAILDSARLLDSMETGPDSFDLADLARKRVTLYVVLPFERLRTHGRWMRLIVQLALQAIASVKSPPDPPCLFLLDELGTINPGGGLASIEQAYGLLGAQGIRVWGFFQSLDQIKRDYTSWRTMVENCEFIQILRASEELTLEYFSKAIGGKTVYVTQGEHETAHPRRVLLPQEIEGMPEGNIIIRKSGMSGAMRLASVPYYMEPRYAGMFRPNPLFPATDLTALKQRQGRLSLPSVTLQSAGTVAATLVAGGFLWSYLGMGWAIFLVAALAFCSVMLVSPRDEEGRLYPKQAIAGGGLIGLTCWILATQVNRPPLAVAAFLYAVVLFGLRRWGGNAAEVGLALPRVKVPGWTGKLVLAGIGAGAILVGAGIGYNELVFLPRQRAEARKADQEMATMVAAQQARFRSQHEAACRSGDPIYQAKHNGQHMPDCMDVVGQ